MKRFIGKLNTFAGALISALAMSAATLLHAQNLSPKKAHEPGPNFLVIITDDQRFGTVQQAMPRTHARIFQEGIEFVNARVTTPICTPSRCSILTGMYASRHGVYDNDTPLQLPTFVEQLHAAGYYTGLVGKYLNSWDATPRPGYDYWIGMPADERYFNPRLNINGNWIDHRGYLTYLLRDYAVNFLKKAAERGSQPFFLFFNPKTPHLPLEVAPGDEALYPDLLPHRPASYNEPDVSDKPRWLQGLPSFSEADRQNLDSLRLKQLQMLWSLDLSIDTILDELKNQGVLDRTVILYLSDHGYFWGEHRLSRKTRVYEEALRVPLGLRYPPLAPKGTIDQRLAANIDIAPTVYKLAGLTIPSEMDGSPLLPLPNTQQSPKPWRTELLIQAWPVSQSYAAVHTGRYVYVENENDRAELYDLAKDPGQLENGASDPNFAAIVKNLKARLNDILVSVGDRPSKKTLPSSFELIQNYPNPFRNTTTIRYGVLRREHVTLQVFDLNGRLVNTLVNREVDPGYYTVRFNAASLSNGMYFYRLQVKSPSGVFVQLKKLVVVK